MFGGLNRYKSQRQDIIQTTGVDDILYTYPDNNGNYAIVTKNLDTTSRQSRLNDKLVLTGLQGWWRLTEGYGDTYYDSSGLGITASSATGTSWNSNGVLGPSINLATAGSISLSANVNNYTFLSNNSFSLAGWIRFINTTSNTTDPLLEIGETTASNKYISIRRNPTTDTMNPNKICFDFYNNSSNSITQIIDGKWHHIAGTYDNINQLRSIYIDGQLDITDTNVTAFTGNLATANSNMNFGKYITNYTNASISDIRIYSKTLSNTDIYNLYTLRNSQLPPSLISYTGNSTYTARGLDGPINTNILPPYDVTLYKSPKGIITSPGDSSLGKPIPILPKSLLGHWPLVNDGATFIPDISGKGLHGTANSTIILSSDYQLGPMMIFNGAGDFIDITDLTPFSLVNSSSFTITMWVKLTNINRTTVDPLFEIGGTSLPGASGGHIYAYRNTSTSGNTVAFSFYNNTLTTTQQLDNSPTHLAFTYDRTTSTRAIMINGVIAAQDTGVASPAIPSITRVRFGYNTIPSVANIAGNLSDIRIYATALESNYIRQIIYDKTQTPSYTARTLDQALRLFLPLSDISKYATQIADYSGYGLYGTSTTNNQYGTTLAGRTGLIFNSAKTQQITIPDNTLLQLTNALTLCTWIYPTSFSADFIIISKTSSAEYELGITTTGAIKFSHGNGSGGSQTDYTTAVGLISLGKWYHISITRDSGSLTGKNVKIYINGVWYPVTQSGTAETAYNVATIASSVTLGSTPANIKYANCIMSEIRIYILPLLPAEILNLYQSGINLNTAPPALPFSSHAITSLNSRYLADGLTINYNAPVNILQSNTVSTYVYIPDLSGCYHNANIVTNSSVTYSNTNSGILPNTPAFQFTGNGYIKCNGENGNAYYGVLGATPYTFSAWINPASLTANIPIINWGTLSLTSNTGWHSATETYIDQTGNVVINWGTDTITYNTQITTNTWSFLALSQPDSQNTGVIKCYKGDITTPPYSCNITADISSLESNGLVLALDMADDNPIDRYTDFSGYNNAGTFTGTHWGSYSPLTTARWGHGQVEYNNNIYVIAGANGPGTGPGTYTYTTSVEIFNGTSWSSGTALTTGLGFAGISVYNGNIHVVGGALSGGTYTNTNYYFNGSSWLSGTILGTGKGELASVTYGGHLYILGGISAGPSYLSTVERYNGSVWLSATNMSVARASAVAAVLNGYIYVCGGMSNASTYLSSVERFDGANWSYAPAMTYARYGAAIAVYNNNIYVIGGVTTGGANTNTIERFDGVKWSVIANFPISAKFGRASYYTTANNLMFTCGTTTGSSGLSTIYNYVKGVGKFGEPVMQLSGNNGNLIVTNTATIDLSGRSAYTVSAWFQPGNITGLDKSIFSSENTSSDNLAAIKINSISGKLQYVMKNNSGVTTTLLSNAALSNNTWYHTVASYDGVNMRLYIDGYLANTASSSGTTATGTARDIYIGSDWDIVKDYFMGNLGEIRLYTTVLSNDAVVTLYKGGPSRVNRKYANVDFGDVVKIGTNFAATSNFTGYIDDIRLYNGRVSSPNDIYNIWSIPLANTSVSTPLTSIHDSSQPIILSTVQPQLGQNIPYYNSNLVPQTTNLATQILNTAPEYLNLQSMNMSNLILHNSDCISDSLTTNLAGWWRLNEGTGNSVADSSIFNNTGTKMGANMATWLPNPYDDYAMYLRGTDQYIKIKDGSSATFPVVGSNFSISGWFNCVGTATGNNAVLGISSNTDTDKFIIYTSPVTSNVIITTAAANLICNAGFTTNTWNHFAVTATDADSLGGNICVYLNNNLIGISAATAGLLATDQLYLGAKRVIGALDNYFTGSLSDIKLFDRSLTTSEIGEMYTWRPIITNYNCMAGNYAFNIFGTPGSSSLNNRYMEIAGYRLPVSSSAGGNNNNCREITLDTNFMLNKPIVANTLLSSNTVGAVGSWSLMTAPPKLENLKLWYMMNEGAGASTAYNFAHTTMAYGANYVGDFTWESTHRNVIAPVFDGTNYLEIDSGSGLNTDQITGGNITISGWVKLSTIDSNNKTIFGMSIPTSTPYLQLYIAASGGALSALANGQTVNTLANIPIGIWSFVALSISNGTEISLYANNPGKGGIADGTGSADYYSTSLGTPLDILDNYTSYAGVMPVGFVDYFMGQISDLKIYNVGLNSEEIANIYYDMAYPYFYINNDFEVPRDVFGTRFVIPADKTVNIAVYYNTVNAILWLDGVQVENTTTQKLGAAPSAVANITANILVGTSILTAGDNPRSYLNGSISDIQIYNTLNTTLDIAKTAANMLKCCLALHVTQTYDGYLADIYDESPAYGNKYSLSSNTGGGNLCIPYGKLRCEKHNALGTQMVFDGISAYIQIMGYLQTVYQRIFTMSMWIRPDADLIVGSECHIISKWSNIADGSNCYKLYYDYSLDTLTFAVGIGSAVISTSAIVKRKTQTHICAQLTPTTINLFVNGVLVSSAALGTNNLVNISNNTEVTIGKYAAAMGTGYYKGNLSVLRIYESVLSASTIRDLSGQRPEVGNDGIVSSGNIRLCDGKSVVSSGLIYWLDTLPDKNDNLALGQTKFVDSGLLQTRSVASNVIINNGTITAANSNSNSGVSNIHIVGSATSNILIDPSDICPLLSRSAFSIGFWGRFNNPAPGNKETVLSIRGDTLTGNSMVDISRRFSDKLINMTFGTSATTEIANDLIVSNTDWHHYLFIYGGNTSVSNSSAASKRSIYIDGMRIALSAGSNIGEVDLSKAKSICLGNDPIDGGAAANINIQDFRIYNRAITNDEAQLLYNIPGTTIPRENQILATDSSISIINTIKSANDKIRDMVGTVGGSARDNLAVLSSVNSANTVLDVNYVSKPGINYNSVGYLSQVVSITENSVILNGSASACMDGVISLGPVDGNVFIASPNPIDESSDWSMSMLVSPYGRNYGNTTIWSSNGNSTSKSLWLNMDGSNVGEVMLQLGVGTANATGVFLPGTKWSQLALTKGMVGVTANVVSLYQDGILKYRRETPMLSDGNAYITLGMTSNLNNSNGMGGNIRDFHLYNNQLSDWEISRLVAGDTVNMIMKPSVLRNMGGPVHHWSFAGLMSDGNSNTVIDMGSLGLSLKVSGVIVQSRLTEENINRVYYPVSGYCGYFGGTGICTAYSTPILGDNARSVMLWVRRGNLTGGVQKWVSWGVMSDSSGSWCSLGLDSLGYVSFATYNTQPVPVRSRGKISDGNWHHISVVILPSAVGTIGDCNNVRIYVDGYLDTDPVSYSGDTILTAKSSSVSSDWLYVGSDGTSNYFTGWLDDIRIYNYALTPDEVLGIYRGNTNFSIVNS